MDQNESSFPEEFNRRLSRLEATVESIAISVQSVVNSSRTNWSVLASWAAVIIATVTAIGALGVGRPLGLVEKQVQDLNVLHRAAAYESGLREGTNQSQNRRIDDLEGHQRITDGTRFTKEDGNRLSDKFDQHLKEFHTEKRR